MLLIHTLYLNGMIVGVHWPKYLVHALRKLRRNGSEHMAILYPYIQPGEIRVYRKDGGKVSASAHRRKGEINADTEDIQRISEQQGREGARDRTEEKDSCR